MTKHSIDEQLRMAATELKRELRGHSGLRLKNKYESDDTGTHGLATIVATWSNRPTIQLWLDKGAGPDRYRFWVGFASDSEKPMDDLYAALPDRFVPNDLLTDDDWVKSGRNNWVIESPNKNVLKKPFCEAYPKRWGTFYFGKYDWGGHGDSNSMKLGAYDAAEFLKKIVDAVNGDDTKGDEELTWFDGAIRQRFVRHRTREQKYRKKKLDIARRENGGRLICQVPRCKFDFNDRYGDKGYGYAQVHHLKPLSQAPESGHSVSMNDLAVVCANCHAMIHYGGKCRSINTLIPKP